MTDHRWQHGEVIYEITDRYAGHAPQRPCPCCDGMGSCPIHGGSLLKEPEWADGWNAAHERCHTVRHCVTAAFLAFRSSLRLPGNSLYDALACAIVVYREERVCDGYHFVECAECGGTGSRTP